MIGFNAAIALAYILNAVYFATRFPVRRDLARWTLAAQGFAAIFFITCAGTHVALASAIYTSDTRMWWFHWDMLLDHGLQAPAGLGFAYIAWRKLDLHLIAQKSNEMTDLANFRAAVLDGAISAIVTTDANGTVLEWNQAAIDIFHYSRQEAEGAYLRDLIGANKEESLADWKARLRRYADGGEGFSQTGQAPCRTKEGAIVICDYGLKRFDSQYGPRLVTFLRDVTARIEAEQGRRRALSRLLHAEAEQRKVVAEELHDDTIQVMTGTLLKLDACEMRIRDLTETCAESETAAEALEDYQVMLTSAIVTLREALRRTRRMMFELRPPMLQEHGVGPAVVALTREIDRETGSHSVVKISIKRYSEVVEELTYRIILESLTNIRKHAKASTVLIDVREGEDGGIHGTVKDDGVGFDMAGILERDEQHLHLGLDSCTERVKLAGGRYFIASEPGSGTTVSFDVPLGSGDVLTWGDLYEAVN